MALYSIKYGKLKSISKKTFNLEKEIQTLTENNLDVIFGLAFVQTEFKVKKFRIDTLAFDDDTKSFVILEYKKNENFSVIDQGYAYLSLMMNNPATFILEYNEKFGKALKKKDVDWSQSRVIFVSPSFTAYQEEAINYKDLPIELWEIREFENNTVMYSQVRSAGAGTTVKVPKKTGKKNKGVIPDPPKKDDLLKGKSTYIKEAFQIVEDAIYQIDGDIIERPAKTMVGYRSDGKGMVWIEPRAKGLSFYLRKGKYVGKLKEKIKMEGWGGYPELYLTAEEISDVTYLKYIQDILKQAYGN